MTEDQLRLLRKRIGGYGRALGVIAKGQCVGYLSKKICPACIAKAALEDARKPRKVTIGRYGGRVKYKG